MTQFTSQEITQELDKENQNQNQESCQMVTDVLERLYP